MISNTFTKFKREELWKVAFNNIQSVPMWARKNNRKYTETSPQQLVCYMKHMQLPELMQLKETLGVNNLSQKNVGRSMLKSCMIWP